MYDWRFTVPSKEHESGLMAQTTLLETGDHGKIFFDAKLVLKRWGSRDGRREWVVGWLGGWVIERSFWWSGRSPGCRGKSLIVHVRKAGG